MIKQKILQKRIKKHHSYVKNLLHPIRGTYPDLGRDATSVQNFCARFSDDIWGGNQWWCHEKPAFFSHYKPYGSQNFSIQTLYNFLDIQCTSVTSKLALYLISHALSISGSLEGLSKFFKTFVSQQIM